MPEETPLTTSDKLDGSAFENSAEVETSLQRASGENLPVNSDIFSTSYVAHEGGLDSSMGDGRTLKKELNLLNAVALIAGVIIGSGIFLTPNAVVAHVGSGAMALVMWLASGIVVLFGSLCYAELGTAVPESGGEYIYLRRAFGPLLAFLYSWTSTLVVRPVSLGIILMTFATYISTPFFTNDCVPPTRYVQVIAISCLVFMTCVACLSNKWSANLSSALFLVKLVAIAFLIVLGVISLSKGRYGQLRQGFRNTSIDITSLSIAFSETMWAYDGWNNANYITGELTSPRLLPIALSIAVPLVIVCYLLVNVAYMSILPTSVFLSSEAIATDASVRMIGETGYIIMPLLVAASCFGAANGTIFSGARVSFESAKRGDLPQVLGLIHKKHVTPITALLFQFVMAVFYISAVDINSLILFFSFMAWLFYCSAMVALIVLRVREPGLPRVLKVPLPLPIIVILFGAFLIVTPFYRYPVQSSIALAFMILSVPIYFVFVSRRLLRSFSHRFDQVSELTVRASKYVLAVR